jgi:transglutaminase/protease-like cytokinesis protein 3
LLKYRDRKRHKTYKKIYQVAIKRYLVNAKVDQIVEQAVGQIIKPEMSEAQQAWAVYKWVNAHITYDAAARYGPNGEIDDYAGLTKGRGVCHHYNVAFQTFMDRLNIAFFNSFSRKSDHIWSIIRADGAWYNVDSTNGPFLRSDDFMAKFWLPPIVREKDYWFAGRMYDARQVSCPNDHPNHAEIVPE